VASNRDFFPAYRAQMSSHHVPAHEWSRTTHSASSSRPTERNAMQYMLSFLETSAEVARRDDAAEATACWGAWSAYVGAIGQSGVVVGVNGL
jgi:hypothetical protein